MISLTINQAIIKLADLEKTYKDKLKNLTSDESATKSYILELNGDRFDCSEVVNFDEEFKLVLELSNEINKLKTCISKANNNTVLYIDGEELSIQECLNILKTSREQLKYLEYMLRYTNASKNRKVDAAGTQPYYKVTELNFDKQEMDSFVNSLKSKILKYELAVNDINNKTVINIA